MVSAGNPDTAVTLTPLQRFYPSGTHCKPPASEAKNSSKPSANLLLLLLCSHPTLFASFKAFWHTQPHRYHLSKKPVRKHPAFLCLVVCGQREARGCRGSGTSCPAAFTDHSHREPRGILTTQGAVEKLRLGLPRVQSPLGGSRRQLRSASTNSCRGCSAAAVLGLSSHLIYWVLWRKVQAAWLEWSLGSTVKCRHDLQTGAVVRARSTCRFLNAEWEPSSTRS